VEAQAAGRLSHPGIVTIFDVAEDEETRTPYLVMEYIEGKSLAQLLTGETGRLPLSTALQLTQELAEALHYAHAQGVIHRDIKPANILITAEGHAKIADFGIAKLNQTNLTVHGQVLGSPAYMAPEQLRDEGADARSDLFSLGVVLYLMLTGQRPFQGNSIATVCFKVANHEPLAVASYDINFPPALDLVVSHAIAKDPALRYQSGEEMANGIQCLRESCGFLPAAERKQDSLTPRPGSYTLPEIKPADHAASDSGTHRANRAFRSMTITATRILAVAVVAAALIFIVFSTTYRNPPPPINQYVLSQPALQPGSVAGGPMPYPPTDAKLDLEIEHSFTAARASVWLDNELVYTQALRGSTKNHMLVFQKTRGHDSHSVELRAGKHRVKVRVQSAAEAYDQSRTLAVNLAPKDEKTLNVNCDKKRNLLKVTLQ
jgi:serine/threonine protein kinase